ncbi:MAG TPA: hypothetical protein DEF43_09260 [Chloroflexus aurantiacus]|jgi:hypothetical protein|uniref:Uncharacterized protein n=1 Tax=Chloroflexus aurantiacus (strain ATCC 29366 / DSM 635 / J-10-fl) TaxID=324602 RepID=A9WAF0_CHLAA|nr:MULTISPECIES: hypothetical protein [Chloroflexus]ABY34709.1 hypothetical protein Caur_1481 [Chloroflexus aurantiacus J-10-fl]RMG46980.1 MAG: hypothetical protein D6716_16510 [Chloroflexota bacterium]HBW67331.1 hypothetical protein [Chloroflexus aurantiacus]
MTFFVGFLVLCLLIGALTPNWRMRYLVLVMMGLSAVVVAAYYFLNLI